MFDCKNTLNMQAAEACRCHWDSIAKPLGSLGLLEDDIAKIAGILETDDVRLEKKGVLAFCADNGVVEEGVSQSGQDVTAIVARNMAAGIANVNAMARAAGADVVAVDVGVAMDVSDAPGLVHKKVMPSTRNMTKGPAMTREEACRAIQAGIDLVGEMKQKGYKILATGEMGIGNTTTSSALVSVLLDKPIIEVTGRGAGLSDAGLMRKHAAIARAIEVNKPDPADALDVLHKIGGLDIAAIAGAFIGGAVHRIPVVVDGFISSAAALVAMRLCPNAKDFMLASHVSGEPAGRMVMDALGLEAPLHARLALGEGTGAVTLFPLLEMALAVYHQNSTFEKINLAAYTRFEEDAK